MKGFAQRFVPLSIVEWTLFQLYRPIITDFSLTQKKVQTSRNAFLILFRFLRCLQIHHYKFQFNQSFLALRDKKIKIIKEVSHNIQLTSLTFDKLLDNAVVRQVWLSLDERIGC